MVVCDTMSSMLQTVYASLYPTLELELNTVIRKYSSVKYRGIHFSSHKKPVIYVRTPYTMEPRAVVLEYFFTHGTHHNGGVSEQAFAFVSWLKQHPAKFFYGKPVKLWWKHLYDSSLNPFIPLQLLLCQSVYLEVKHECQTVYMVVPVHNIPIVYT